MKRLSELEKGETFCLATSSNLLVFRGSELDEKGEIVYCYKKLDNTTMFKTKNNYTIL